MNFAKDVLDPRIEKRLRGLYTSCTATVTEVKTSTCNVKLDDGADTELFDVPFTENVKRAHHHNTINVSGTDVASPEISDGLQTGDKVVIIFSKFPLVGVSARRFDLNDAIVIAKF